MINYKELTGLIDAGKDEEIQKALQNLPEQAVIALMDMQDAPHKQYLINLLNPFVPSADSLLAARKGDTSNWDDELIDYAFRTYANGDMPREADFDYDPAKYEEAFDKFMSDGSSFQNYVAGLRKKYGESITGSNDEQPDTGINAQSLSLDDLWNNINDFGMVGEDSDDFTKNEWNKLIDVYDMAVENTARSDPDKLVEHLLHKGFSGNALGRAAHEVIDEYHPDYEIDESMFGPVYAEDDEANPNDKRWLNEWLSKHHYVDTNGDGDTDVITADTNGNGKPDTAVVAGDDAKEEKEAVKAAKEDLGLDGDDDTSTGKKKKELEDDNADVLSDKKQKDTCSDSRQKNIISALSELRF
jgi:hypothetical protein